MNQTVDVAQNLRQVQERISAACRRAGRDPRSVALVVVTKAVEPARMQQARAVGAEIFGESRVQELLEKQPEFPGMRWHFIGHLQRNKVKYLPGRVELVHSLDRWSLAQELGRRGSEQGRPFRVLVQVNIAGERGKFGVMPADLEGFVREAAGLRGLQVEGLMAMAPLTFDLEAVRPLFREMRELFTVCARIRGVRMRYLSMGMSSDYPVAVEEGANLVRVGTAIFGP